MFSVGFGTLCAYAGIAFVLWAMTESGISKGIIEGAAWVGYIGLAIGFITSLVLLLI